MMTLLRFLGMALLVMPGLMACRHDAVISIHDETLYPFLLRGIYTVHEYGGAEVLENTIQHNMQTKPGDAAFLTELKLFYRKALMFPYHSKADPEGLNARKKLKEWEEVDNKEELNELLTNLLEKGDQAIYERYRKALEENCGKKTDVQTIDPVRYHLPYRDNIPATFEFIKLNYERFSPAGIKAWDLARLADNVCIGHQAGYLSDVEAALWMKKLSSAARLHYNTWHAYYSDFILGRQFWGGGKEEMAYEKDVQDMLQGEYSIYTYVPFE